VGGYQGIALLGGVLQRARTSACIAAILGLAAVAGSNSAAAEDLDAGKSGARLFTSNCTSCHHTPKGLAKRSNAFLLTNFLQLHYTASRQSAGEIAAYLTAIDYRAGARPTAAPPHRTIRAPTGGQRNRAPRPPMALARP
jgi:mono/diheme cytochrome c family protein